MVETYRVIAMCSHELALLRALCGNPEEPTAAELAVILDYVATRAKGRSYDESVVEPYLIGPAPSPMDIQRAAAQVVGYLDHTTLPAFRQAAIVLSAIGSPEAAVVWEGVMQRAIDGQERRDAARRSRSPCDPPIQPRPSPRDRVGPGSDRGDTALSREEVR